MQTQNEQQCLSINPDQIALNNLNLWAVSYDVYDSMTTVVSEQDREF